jgi:MFS family permease
MAPKEEGATVAHEQPVARSDYLLLGFQCWQSFFITGVVFGWPALLLMLTSEGIYQDECAAASPPNPEIECKERTLRFNLVFTCAASVSQASGLFVGFALDKFGPKRTMLVGSVLVISASLMFAFGTNDLDLFPVAYSMYAGGGYLFHLPSFSLSNRFGKKKSLVLSILVGMFSLSGSLFSCFLALNKSAGLTRAQLFCGHAVILFVNSLITAKYWPDKPFDSNMKNAAHAEPEKATGESQTRKLGKILTSFEYISATIAFAVGLLIVRLYMGTCNDQLGKATNDESKRDQYTDFFNIFASLGVLASPAFSYVAGLGGYSLTELATWVCLLVALATSLCPVIEVQLVTFLGFSVGRQFLFSKFYGFMLEEYGLLFGRASGIAGVAAGAVNYLQNPLLRLTLESFDGDWAPVIVGQMIACGLGLLVLAVAWKRGGKGTGGNEIEEDALEAAQLEKTLTAVTPTPVLS